MIAFGGDLDTFRIDGGGTVIFGGVILLLLSILILVNPFAAGIAAVIVVAGVGLILFGLLLCWLSVKLKDIHKYQEKEYPR